ncbi:M1 family metallopeptidase [Streptomyces panaciradicis]|uniref:M1 family metallopeptidase n=1 Tax=Streptomyces panaciradicis TaxID=1470261 RepID=UPI00201CBFBF|nr:M1 family metallopeptidase [Streptomyces panaciradicis]MCL6668450.1 M1 family metallopeptidase [Streptomyces panaciradicis]
MSRFAPVAPAAVTLLLALTACSGGVHGTPGGSGVHDPYFPKAGNGGYDVDHYDLKLAYTPGKGGRGDHLTGTATLTARATEDLSAFDLDLKGLDVEDVTVEGRRARFQRAGQELTVRPHDDIHAAETFRVTVRYSGTPETITDPDGSQEGWLPTTDGALALGEPTGSMAWFPCDNHPSDKATYDLAITVPKGLQAVSNGEPTGERTSGNRTTSTWHTAEPMASYLATVAVGHFDITRSTIGKDRLPSYVAVDPAEAKPARKVLAKLPEIMEWEEYNFGPYPFSSTGAIVDRPQDAGYALETQNRPVFPGAPDTGTLVHELAHQWYGDSVTPKTWRDMWLNEGFATYAEWLWDEDHGGDSVQHTFEHLYAHGEDEYPDLWSFPPGRPSGAAHISDSPVYVRGAMVLQQIRRTVGDDTFYDIIQGWAATHRHGNADTAEFTAYVEKKAPGKDFDAIWRDWLYGKGRPDHL